MSDWIRSEKGGQRQLMLFDEVTSALDPELIGGILDEMKKLALGGVT